MGFWFWVGTLSTLLVFETDVTKAEDRLGFKHINTYPVSTTQMLIPEQAFNKLVSLIPKKNAFDSIFKWLGLHEYLDAIFTGEPEHFRMGLGRIEKYGAQGLTISCAGCHVGTLFGKTVVGMSNRFPRANEFFADGKFALKFSTPEMFELMTGASPGEKQMFIDMKKASRRIGIVKPQSLGLDTSLAQVALSLARRNSDEWASFNSQLEKSPRADLLDHHVADSKPAVWWNLKYKTRFLSDGSIVSGDPIFTNFLWNEIGRGADLRELDQWFKTNEDTIRELREFVFNTSAPHWSDFFGKGTINVARARQGSALFHANCASCHGAYEKNWKTLENILVKYPTPTPVIDVGTDPGRREGMESLARGLNHLQISKNFVTVIEVQHGYVPPPLEGIFARFPYFHNNSVPSLCAVLTLASERPKHYYSRKQIDPQEDFDSDCVGYPSRKGDRVHFYDTTQPGQSNSGHDEGVFLKNGQEMYTPDQKRDIIEFLKTL
ncbi:MAG: c-type cytochrome [Xanthomonadaceae bacterium]|nr:c-type cytochrome [Xanthomonadaceae bacterium]